MRIVRTMVSHLQINKCGTLKFCVADGILFVFLLGGQRTQHYRSELEEKDPRL